MGDQSYLLQWGHDDYDLAKQHILQQLGDYHAEMEVWGRDVLIAVYTRPKLGAGRSIQMPASVQAEDQFQGKTGMVLMMGPEAFKGTPEWMAAKFGSSPPPAVGDWLFCQANDGISMQIAGAGASVVTVPVGKHGDVENAYPWTFGWNCRLIRDDLFMGRVLKPHMVI